MLCIETAHHCQCVALKSPCTLGTWYMYLGSSKATASTLCRSLLVRKTTRTDKAVGICLHQVEVPALDFDLMLPETAAAPSGFQCWPYTSFN